MTERSAPAVGGSGLPGWLARRLPFYYGWVVVAVGGLAVVCGGPGQSSVIAAFLEPMSLDLGLSRSAVSGAFTVGTLLAALAMGPVGRLTDRYGGQVVLLGGALALGATCLLMGRVDGLLGLAAGFAALRLLVQGPLTLTSTTLIAQWFIRRRGRAQSLLSLGTTASFAFFPPLAQYLIDHYTWRAAWAAVGWLIWLVLLPPVLLLVRARPEAMGLRPDGEPVAPAPAHAPRPPAPDEPAWTAPQARRTLTFWLISIAISLTWLVGAGLNFHQVALLTDRGLSAQFAASIFTVTGVASIPATMLAGWVVDRLPARRLLIVLLVCKALAPWWLLWTATPLLAVVYGGLNGLINGLSSVLSAVIFATYYGRRHLGSIRGITMVLNVGASALGPLPLGLARDLTGSYDLALVGLGLLPLLGALAMRWVAPPGEPGRRA